MATDIHLQLLNNSMMRVVSDDPGIVMEMSEYFTHSVPGAKFTPAYKRGWDGKVRYLNPMTCLMYAGLVHRVKKFCTSRNYTLSVDDRLLPGNVSNESIVDFVKTLGLPFEPKDYQYIALKKAISTRRMVVVSPTGSGKSLIAYLITRYCLDILGHNKVLVIVPTVSLVHQMASDFEEYGFKEPVHKILGGREKKTGLSVVVSTWQSIYKQEAKWFSDVSCVIGDEAHGFGAKSLISIMDKMSDTSYRIGMTGTLPDDECSKITLEGLFGEAFKYVSTSELMERGDLTPLKIRVMVLKYDADTADTMKGADYDTEIKYIVTNEKRLNFVAKLALSLKGNTLVFFRFVERHGKPLYNKILELKEDTDDRPVFYISGEVDSEIREGIRKKIESLEDSISVVSQKTTSTGTNIKRVNNIIFAHPTKSKITNLQSIGRALRKLNGKEQAVLYDIGDVIQNGSKKNMSAIHLIERIKLYAKEDFKYQIIEIDFNQST